MVTARSEIDRHRQHAEHLQDVHSEFVQAVIKAVFLSGDVNVVRDNVIDALNKNYERRIEFMKRETWLL